MSFYPLRRVWNQDWYQGGGKKRNYCEGWYIRIASSDEKHVWAVIPGVSLGQDQEQSCAFIQVIDGRTNETCYIPYPLSSFRYSRDRFEVRIADNLFSRSGMKLNIRHEGLTIRGSLSYSRVKPYPSSFFSPGIMGPFSFMPFMECRHALVSLDHAIRGTLLIKGRKVNFTGGRGYSEKTWGRSFPRSWIWVQSNHFSRKETSFVCAMAKVPWLGRSFTGFFAVLLNKGKITGFSNLTGARVLKLDIKKQNIFITLKDKQHLLNIRAVRRSCAELKAPLEGLMVRRIGESLCSEVRISLYDFEHGLIFRDIGRNAGCEVVGPLSNIFRCTQFSFR